MVVCTGAVAVNEAKRDQILDIFKTYSNSLGHELWGIEERGANNPAKVWDLSHWKIR